MAVHAGVLAVCNGRRSGRSPVSHGTVDVADGEAVQVTVFQQETSLH
jgi:hypothetical protein